MGAESIIRKAAPWLVRKKQSLLEPLEGTAVSLRVGGKTKPVISQLTKPQKESGKWHGSVSYVRRLFGRRTSKSLGPGSHSADTQNIVLDLGDSQDGGGNRKSLRTPSPQVSNLPTPQPTQTGQPLHLNPDEDPVARRREMKLEALERAQIQEELSEAARLRGGCVPCCKGTVTLASPQNDAPGLSIQEREPTRLTQVSISQWRQSRSRAQSRAGQPQPGTESRSSQEPFTTLVEPLTPRVSLAIHEEGPPPSRPPSQWDTRPRRTSQTDSRSRRQSQTPRSRKPSVSPQAPSSAST